MMTPSREEVETLIIGGGLSGLYAAFLLTRLGRPFVLLEARNRLGGRIHGKEVDGYCTDLGPSWYWPGVNPGICSLMLDLNLQGFPQFEEGLGRFQLADGSVRTVRGYGSEPRSWRILGGMPALVEGLAGTLDQAAVLTDHPVCELEKKDGRVLVRIGELDRPVHEVSAGRVILALPPRLAAATILFTPDLPHDLTQAMLQLGTWMAGQAKFYALYDRPFWRRCGLSGQAFSQYGPLGEIHDGSNQDQGPFGLTGFVAVPAAQRTPEQAVVSAVLEQLSAIYGPEAGTPLTIHYQDWARERYTATGFDQRAMRQHPVYRPPAGRTSIWDGLVRFAGTETAEVCGGYLEGALNGARRAVMAP